MVVKVVEAAAKRWDRAARGSNLALEGVAMDRSAQPGEETS